jgi:DNA processing protein
VVELEKEGISRETLVAIHETEGIGWKTVRELWDGRKSRPIRAGMREGDLRDCGLNAKQAAAMAANLTAERMEESRERRSKAGIGVLTLADRDFPRRLKKTADSPPVLYYKGRLELISRPSIAVVGTRLATAYGRHLAEQFSSEFAGRGLTVVSGLARGIDTCAHRGALFRPGGTIAVLGTPVERIYPPENRQLYGEIAEHGLLLSEAPPHTPYHRGMFPSRNRIISGLSLGVLIVEAPEGSGALITAHKAMEADRPVFVIPGPVTSPRSRGGLLMLQDGTAQPVLEAEDILRKFQPLLASSPMQAESAAAILSLTEPESHVFDILMDRPRSLDELADSTGMAFGVLHGLLLSLQMKKRICQLPGALYGVL